MASRRAKGFPRADDSRRAEGLAAAVLFDRGAGSFGPFAEICKREWANCQQKQSAAAAAAANSFAGWLRRMAPLRAPRRAGASRPPLGERCQRSTWAKALDWWCHCS